MNVTIRTSLGLYANIRPCQSYAPFIPTKHPNMNVVIVRENEEDLYTGIEHRQTYDTYQCLKLITRPGTYKIIKYAFEYARANNRKKVSCFVKDNIMKMSDGLFSQIFAEVSKDYPDIQTDQFIIDIGAARLADTPTMFDVIVTLNLYGDIISDIAAQVTGSVGLGGSANIGDHVAMFEAIHGSAPQIAGKNIANPSGLLHGAISMLNHIQQPEVAALVHNAWLKTIEDRIFTVDLKNDASPAKIVNTSEFTKAVIERLGKNPTTLPVASYNTAKKKISIEVPPRASYKKDLVGVDVFVHWDKGTPDEFGNAIKKLAIPGLELSVITNRGVKV